MLHKYYALATLLAIFASRSWQLTSGNESAKLYDQIKSLNPCVSKMVYSFTQSYLYPRTTIDGLKESCQSQADGVKCVKEKSKTLPVILKRGLTIVVQNRQRFNKKYCSDFKSDISKRLVTDFKCVMEKRLESFAKAENKFSFKMLELVKRNFNDSATELKYLCCTVIEYRKGLIDSTGTECASARSRIEEMIVSQVPNDISLLCEDDDKMANECSKLEPIRVPSGNFDFTKSVSPSITSLYLVATLGEPDNDLAAELRKSSR